MAERKLFFCFFFDCIKNGGQTFEIVHVLYYGKWDGEVYVGLTSQGL
jgi:hypothetical protein